MANASGRLISVNVGMPRDITWQGRVVRTAIWKDPVKGPCMARRLDLDGDGQGDLTGHGGAHRAVLVYQLDSYRYWQNHLGRDDFVRGQFGENFTVDGLADEDVCIGDRYRIGRALFEVSQPRVTCYRLGIRLNEPEMAALVVRHGRPGFYLRVLEEGAVEAGDEITLVGSAPERMSVSEIDALLYMSGHSVEQLQRALDIPALSPGWRKSFEALLAQAGRDGATTGNAGLTKGSGPPPAWRGFRPLRIARKIKESRDVTSLVFEPSDGRPLAAALPGQFVVLRLGAKAAPAMMRSYSLSGAPGASSWRVSVKREPHGAASLYVSEKLEVGDIAPVSAARGGFTLRPGAAPVVLLSAGIGVTPVLAMLYALAAEPSTREVWWLQGARNGRERLFAEETRCLLAGLPHSHSFVCYSSPDPKDRPHVDFDAPGRLGMQVLEKLGLPQDGDFYICGPLAFMDDLTAGLSSLGVASERIHTEIFSAGPSMSPGVTSSPRPPPHLPPGSRGAGPLVSFARTGLNVRWDSSFASLLELAEACDAPVRWSCRTGVCHSCETGLIAGTIRYRPEPVDAAAEGNVLICCAQPEGDLVIDL